MAIISASHVYAWETPTIMIGGNQLTYQDMWPSHQTNSKDYYALVQRNGRTYRTNIHQGAYIPITTQTDSHFSGIKVTKQVNANAATSNWYFQTDQAFGKLPTLTYTLDDDQLDFAGFAFQYKVEKYGAYKKMKAPLFHISVCDDRPIAFSADDNGRVSLPNPGTCDVNHRQIKITLIKPAFNNANDYALIKFYSFTFNILDQVISDPAVVRRLDGQEFATVHGETIICQDTICPVNVGDYISVGDVDENGVMLSIAEWTNDQYEYNYYRTDRIKVNIQQVTAENDGGISILFANDKFYNHNRLRDVVLGISQNADDLLTSWPNVHQLEETAREDLGGYSYLSPTQGWQVANFPADASLDWRQGFYLSVRLRDVWGQYTSSSQIYFCRHYRCEDANYNWQRDLYFSQVNFGDEKTPPRIRIHLPHAETDLTRFRVYERQDEGVYLDAGSFFSTYDARTTLNDIYVTLTWPELNREGGHLYLYDREQKQIIDELQFTAVASPYGLVRDRATWEWKENYVRN